LYTAISTYKLQLQRLVIVAAPRLWNDLPANVISAPTSLSVFKKRLKQGPGVEKMVFKLLVFWLLFSSYNFCDQSLKSNGY